MSKSSLRKAKQKRHKQKLAEAERRLQEARQQPHPQYNFRSQRDGK